MNILSIIVSDLRRRAMDTFIESRIAIVCPHQLKVRLAQGLGVTATR